MITVKYKKAIYPKVAVLKASYHLLDRAYVHIDMNEDSYIVFITAKPSFSDSSLRNEFDNEVLAQSVRYHVYEQTHEIRKLLVARAMASTIINAVPENIVEQENTESLDDILTDWFDKYES